MSIIVAFIGSPRKNGYSTRLLNQVLNGANANGAEVVIYDLNADGIVATFPLYFINIGGQAKLWLDRLYPMIDGKFAARFPGKKAICGIP